MEKEIYPILGRCKQSDSHMVVNYTDGIDVLSSYCLDCNTLSIDNETIKIPDTFVEELQNTYEVLRD